jgi:hypothetical protein
LRNTIGPAFDEPMLMRRPHVDMPVVDTVSAIHGASL